MPSGRTGIVFEGRIDDACNAHIVLKSFDVFWQSLRRGGIGFATSYLDGHFEVNDLRNVFRFFLRNKSRLTRAGRGWFRVRLPDKTLHWRRANTRLGSRRNIAAHYDLGNRFYSEWLDRTMTYSSALFQGEMPLESAQETKYRRLADLLGLSKGTSLLEIGCGWGGMAEVAARRGADVLAITVSHQQLLYTRRRLVKSGLCHKARAEFIDYRDVSGQYDRIVSIEMIEAVGEANWQTYFDVLAQRLKAGGAAAIQAITIDPQLFIGYRRNPEFIQRYIFPGGILPTETVMQKCASSAGLKLEFVERFGESYARTLAEWRSRFLESWPRIESLGFDTRFKRMWLYYLTYCEVGFEQGTTDVGIYLFRKPATT
ncbi:MAG: class I SAM-dependent methyltransferase [Hyphomicrobiaceae bacterium]